MLKPSQYVDEVSTIKVYWTKQVSTTLLQEIEFKPADYIKENQYPTTIALEKKLNGASVIKLTLNVAWD